jgi:hypothetical protein
MVLSLAVLAFVLYSTINENEEGLTNTYEPMELNNNNDQQNRPEKKVRFNENMENSQPLHFEKVNEIEETLNNYSTNEFETRNLEEGFNYEDFDANPVSNDVGAPIDEMNDTLTVDAESDDLEIDGTDLLAAPLADRFHSLNSIANVNRNSSNDLRGDIEIKYNDKYTPFYSSHIYGEPLHTNKLH